MAATETMEAGRELDALVCTALGIPGRVEYYAQAPGSDRAGWYFSGLRSDVEQVIADHDRRMPDSWSAGSTVEQVTHYPPVSTDIAAAWEVVGRMEATGYTLALTRLWDAAPSWQAELLSESYETAVGQGDTPALAICRAALAAVDRP